MKKTIYLDVLSTEPTEEGKFTPAPNKMEVELSYSLGGMNYFSGTNEPRGVYVSVSPIQKSERATVFTAFSGIKDLILPLNRKPSNFTAALTALKEQGNKDKLDGMLKRVAGRLPDGCSIELPTVDEVIEMLEKA